MGSQNRSTRNIQALPRLELLATAAPHLDPTYNRTLFGNRW
jgi:hypothetical protein